MTGGRVTGTGIAGLALGSGSGWLERALGYTCDSLLAAEVVTADGRQVRASEDENPELFWGLRGGGGNFGIVTAFHFRLHEVGPIVLGGMLMYPTDIAPELVRFYRDFMLEAPNAVGTGLAFISAPPLDFIPEPVRGKPVIGVVVCCTGPVEEAEELMRPLREFGPPALDIVQPMPYVAVQQLLEPGAQKGMQNYWTADFLDELPDEAVEALTGTCDEARVAADPGHPRAGRRGCGGRGRGRDGVRPAERSVEPPPALDVAGPGRHRDEHRLDARPRRGDQALDQRARLPQLHRRRGARAGRGGLRAREVPAAAGAQGRVGPGEPVPPQPEHPADRRLTVGGCPGGRLTP